LMEGDGYYVLMDVLRTENLRSRSFRWLLDGLSRDAWRPSAIRRNLAELGYSIGSMAYLSAMVALSIQAWQRVLVQWLGRVVSPGTVTAIGWLFALLAISSFGVGFVGELYRHAGTRRQRSTPV